MKNTLLILSLFCLWIDFKISYLKKIITVSSDNYAGFLRLIFGKKSNMNLLN